MCIYFQQQEKNETKKKTNTQLNNFQQNLNKMT